jgi:hypothetical protein
LKVGVLSVEGNTTLLWCGKCGAVSKIVIEEFVEGSF